jgi:hypothetical protein
MKNIKNSLKALFVTTLFLGTLASCEDQGYDEYEEGVSPTVALNGEWFIDITDAATGDVYVQHAFHKTYDSGLGDGTMYISDVVGGTPTGWYTEGLLNTNPAALTFSGTDVDNTADPGTTFTITEGKVLKGAARSRTGVVVDSIYFKGTFSYDPETVLIFAGHKRTGFEEDEF